MFRLLKKVGNLIDALDLGGWLCLGSGVAIVAVTVLAPAWLDVRDLRHERSILRRQAAILDARHGNYQTFIRAVEGNDPLLLRRLAWHHLRLKPVEEDPVEFVSAGRLPDLALDPWMQPTTAQLPEVEGVPPLPDTRLVRLVFGPSRLWVLAFGGWLMLVGLLISPKAGRAVTPQRCPIV